MSKYEGPERREHLVCEQASRIAQIEINQGSMLENQGGFAVALEGLKEQTAVTNKTVEETYKRLFVNNGVDSFQTMFQKGTARMDAQALEIRHLHRKLLAHEERPKKVLGIVSIVLPLIIGLGAAVYHLATWFIDHFEWR